MKKLFIVLLGIAAVIVTVIVIFFLIYNKTDDLQIV